MFEDQILSYLLLFLLFYFILLFVAQVAVCNIKTYE